ncbi:MAG: RimK/LysX family protein [Candidatus Saccharimonadales bacterium]|jgi:hypothetical protein
MQKVIGAFEKVSLPDFGLFDVVAKVDTGATSGSVHATRIKEVLLSTGEKAVQFLPFGLDKAVTATGFTLKEVRSSNGAVSLRYCIPTTVTIRGVQYPISVTLADRTLMKKGVLIGRQFLRDHGFLVDATKGTKYRGHVK